MISHEKILKKIQSELNSAENAAAIDKVREHARAIKLLAELILDEEEEGVKIDQVIHTNDDHINKSTPLTNQYDNPGSLLDF
ncbi:DUF5327 family protein [Amphibacillus sediminis]|uniref:DUF5327 family protein n=1 Tax=Amphibacillus sediminis TaxID=360185 RepID=UPI00083474A4|nr:DUF5327 family protein [Amphibacillus sediminis]